LPRSRAGSLQGIPTSIRISFAVARGFPTGVISPSACRQIRDRRPGRANLRRQLATVMGKTIWWNASAAPARTRDRPYNLGTRPHRSPRRRLVEQRRRLVRVRRLAFTATTLRAGALAPAAMTGNVPRLKLPRILVERRDRTVELPRYTRILRAAWRMG
jgi:hypothetical protein